MERLARGLGGFSLALGIPQVTMPGGFARWIGARDEGHCRAWLRAVGLREIAAGVAILSRRRPVGWLWARVAGDAMDLALLSLALRSGDAYRGNRTLAAIAAVVGVTVLDLYCSLELSRRAGATPGRGQEDYPVHVKNAITIKRSPEEVYRFWRDFQNLPRFMSHLEAVQVIDERRSHWRATAPAGRTVEWDAEMLEDRPNELIVWRSLEGADVDNSGRVRFRPGPGGRGTEVEVELRYDPPGGKLATIVAKLFGEDPSQQVYGDLRRLKQVLETGEVVRSDAVLDRARMPQRPAQPPEGGRPQAMATG